MRTTVDLDEDLLAEAKQLGVSGGRSLSKVVEDALRAHLARASAPPAPGPARFTAFEGRHGLLPGVDLEDKEALTALLDDEDCGAPR